MRVFRDVLVQLGQRLSRWSGPVRILRIVALTGALVGLEWTCAYRPLRAQYMLDRPVAHAENLATSLQNCDMYAITRAMPGLGYETSAVACAADHLRRALRTWNRLHH